MKIKCKECEGEGVYEVACWEQSKMVNCECSYCDGQGYTEEDIEEYIKPKIKSDLMKTYHITYFIHRGDVELNEKPLLGGITLEAESIILAIGKFLNENKVKESEIKYIVEL